MQNSSSTSPLLDIDRRQDDVLQQLDELERRIQRVLAEYAPADKGASENAGLAIFRPGEDADHAEPGQEGADPVAAKQE
jgi:hypothetical protein